MMLRFNLILVFITLGSLIISAWGHNKKYNFKQISIAEGLSQSSANCVLHDYKGNLWIGTKCGLNRFDQFTLKNYYSNNNDDRAIAGNYILDIKEDNNGDVWVATDRGLSHYKYSEDRFKTVCSEKVNCILLYNDLLLFALGDKLFSINPETFKIDPIDFKKENEPSLVIQKILAKSAHEILIVTRSNGIFSYDFNSGHTCKFVEPLFGDLKAACLSSDNRLYLSFYQQGLYRFNTDGSPDKKILLNSQSPYNDIILDVIEKEDHIWIATDGGGIYILHPENGYIENLSHNPGDKLSMPVNSILSLYKDKQNNIWAGTVRGGVIGIKETYMKTYQDAALGSTLGLSEKTVISLFEDQDSVLWIGTDGGGINRFDKKTERFHHYPSTYGDKLLSISNYSSNKLIVSLYEKGLFLFDKQNAGYESFQYLNEMLNHFEGQSGYTPLVHSLWDNVLCINSYYSYLFDTRTFKFIKLDCEGGMRARGLKLLYTTNDMAFFAAGEILFSLKKNANTIKEELALNGNMIINALTSSDDTTFWLGTNDGVLKYDRNKGDVSPAGDNLIHNVSNLTYDNGNLWIATHNLLFSYMIADDKFILCDEADGFTQNELLFMYQNESKTNNIYLAGTDGLLIIDKQIIYEDSLNTTIELNDIHYDGKQLPVLHSQKNKINIPYNYNSLSVGVNLKNCDVFRKTIFRYDIRGMINQCIETENRNIRLPLLLPGEYTLSVSCLLKNGSWSIPCDIVSITITPPWYKTITFFLILLCFLISLLAILFFLIYKRREKQFLEERQQEQKKMKEDKMEFLINISHELRTPLTLIYSPLRRKLSLERDAEKTLDQDEIKSIFKQTALMHDMVNMILDIPMMESPTLRINKEDHSLNDWVMEVICEFEEEALHKGIRLLTEFDPGIKNVLFDEWKCRIVISNLLMNAIKFSTPDGQIMITTKSVEDRIRISVTDNGIGLKDEDALSMFDLFYQGDHNRGGNGIGLNYAKRLVELHGGTISAFNNPGGGATVYFELPIRKTERGSSVFAESGKSSQSDFSCLAGFDPSSQDLTSYAVLIVEDNRDLRNFLKSNFNGLFKKVYTAENGKQGLEVAASVIPDLIITDVMMPVMNGMELCCILKNNPDLNHIPVLMLTAKSDSESARLGYANQADYYISKPFDIDYLLCVISSIFANRENLKNKYKGLVHQFVDEDITPNNNEESFLKHLNELIILNISNPDFDVNKIASEIGMSRTSLYSKVKSLTQIGVGDYINRVRIEIAAEMLIKSDKPISEISCEVGFAYPTYFSTLFKQEKGVSPSGFRKENKIPTPEISSNG